MRKKEMRVKKIDSKLTLDRLDRIADELIIKASKAVKSVGDNPVRTCSAIVHIDSSHTVIIISVFGELVKYKPFITLLEWQT